MNEGHYISEDGLMQFCILGLNFNLYKDPRFVAGTILNPSVFSPLCKSYIESISILPFIRPTLHQRHFKMSADSYLHFIYSQWFLTPKAPTTSFAGQTVIVTGSNTGLGQDAIRQMVALGAEKAIIACRSIEKGERAKAEIEKSTGKQGVVEVWQLDLGSYESVKQFAKRASGLSRLDVLLENAGVATHTFRVLEEDESTITTNVVSTFLLGFLLLPKLKETAKTYNTRPHLTIVSSETHAGTKIPERLLPGKLFDNLNKKENAKMFERYPVSKLLEVLIIRAFVDEYAPSADKYPVIVNYLNPGFCVSELMREMGWLAPIARFIMHARTTEEGARALVIGAAAGPQTHGQYMSNGQLEGIGSFVFSEDGKRTQQRAWTELKDKLQKIQPGIFEKV